MRTAVLAVVLCIAGCSGLRFDGRFSSAPNDWTMAGGGPERTNVAPVDIRPPFTELWRYNAQGGVRATPLVRDSVVVVTTLHGELQLVSIQNGRRFGYKGQGAAIEGGAALDGQNVIVTTTGKEGGVRSYGLREGKPLWTASVGPVESSPLLMDAHIYVSTLAGEIVCVRRADGEVVWTYAPRSKRDRKPFRSSPASSDGVLVCGNDDGILYAVDASTGTARWSFQTLGSLFATPVISRGLVITGNIRGRVVACDLRTGEMRWEQQSPGAVYAAAASDGRSVYIADASGTVTAYRTDDGELLWSWAAGSVINAAPLVSPSYLYLGSLDRRFHVLDKTSGQEVWSMPLEGRMKVTPVIWGRTLILTYEDKTVAAYRQGPVP